MSAKDSFNCACGDDAFKITAERMVDSWVTQGHWCSTVMSMLNSDGSPRYVWNPYSLREMEAILFRVQKSGKPWLQEYLLCVATSGADCTPPTASIFERQQVGRDVEQGRPGLEGSRGPVLFFIFVSESVACFHVFHADGLCFYRYP